MLNDAVCMKSCSRQTLFLPAPNKRRCYVAPSHPLSFFTADIFSPLWSETQQTFGDEDGISSE